MKNEQMYQVVIPKLQIQLRLGPQIVQVSMIQNGFWAKQTCRAYPEALVYSEPDHESNKLRDVTHEFR